MSRVPTEGPAAAPPARVRLERALAAFKELPLPPAVARRALTALLSSDAPPRHGRVRLLIGLALALASELPLPVFAQEAAREPARPVEVDASWLGGVRVSAPEAAGFTFEAHLAARAELEAAAADAEPAEVYFEVPLVRPLLVAGLADGMFRVLVQPELAGSAPRLLDLHLDFTAAEALRLRVGQFRTPLSRAYITPIVQLQLPDRGVVSDTFRAGRDTGLMVSGTPGVFEYDVGIFNGSGIDGRLGDTPAPMVVGRLAVTPYGSVPYDQTPVFATLRPSGLSIGLDGMFRQRNVAQEGDPELDQATATAGADLAIVEGPFSFFAEGYLREQQLGTDPWRMSWGAYAQAGVFVLPRIVEVAARGSWVDPDADAPGNFVQAYDAAANVYFFLDDVAYGQHLKLSLRYRFVHAADPFGTFVEGDSHRFTTQLQAWI